MIFPQNYRLDQRWIFPTESIETKNLVESLLISSLEPKTTASDEMKKQIVMNAWEEEREREREREREYREKRSRELTDSQIKDFFKFGSSIWNLGNFEI